MLTDEELDPEFIETQILTDEEIDRLHEEWVYWWETRGRFGI